jgi:hypothetical protein
MSLNRTETSVHLQSPSQAKIALFRFLFRGREDVYARRFESRKTGKAGVRACLRQRVGARDLREATDQVLRLFPSAFSSGDR